MDNLVIDHVKRMNRTPAWTLVSAALQETADISVIHYSYAGLTFDVEAIVATIDDEPVGFICYKYDEADGSYDIHQSYVVKGFRNKGIHTSMFEKLVSRAKKKNVSKITSSTSVNNLAAQRAFEKQGRVATSIAYVYVIADWLKKG